MSADSGFTFNAPVQELLRTYAPDPGRFDELMNPDGSIRPAWEPVLRFFAEQSSEERRASADRLERALRDHHVTFIAQDDTGRAHRPWPLDFFPFLISPAEWRLLETGLRQRARLLNEILTDLYGDRRILNEGRLPPGALFGTPQFLRPCSRIDLRGDCHVHFLAFDVGRSPDGRWWVLSDRTEAPSGAGYALENRIVTSRSFADLFEEHNVQRHAGFFREFSHHFLNLAGRDEPLAVFLSRGPHKHTYFEHTYLARYLGFPVVEGSDLAVRNDRVFLKTVEGLRPVDLVMRSIRSEMCDPLELRADSSYGVPGLLQVARNGNVVIGNALGSGVVESAAFLSFLPALSRFYLGEDLALPSVATWWCGQKHEHDYVVENLDRLIIRQISTTRSLLAQGQDGRVGNGGPGGRAGLEEQLAFRGHDFVAQETVTLSTAPVWMDDGTLRAVPTVLRLFVAATEDGYRVMPGGLARASINPAPQQAWLGADDVSKDIWVLADRPVDNFVTLAGRLDPTDLRRSRANLPSRAADSLFWLGRYMERADAALRLLRSLVIRLGGEMSSSRQLVTPERIISLLIAQRHLAPRRGRRAIDEGRDAVRRELWAVIFDPESRDGLATVLNHVGRNAEAVRERLSVDAYRILTELTELPRKRRARTLQPDVEEALSLLNRSIQLVAAFGGLVMENMTRSFGWRFLDMGRRLERIRATTQLLRQLTVRGDPEEDGSLELLLELADITMTYLSRYHSRPHLPQLADLLLADETNPRSVVFQLEAISGHLEHLARPQEGEILSRDQQIAIRLISDLKLADVFSLTETVGRFGARTNLHRLCRELDNGITEMSDYVSHRYFSHTEARRLRTSDPLRDLEA